MPLKYGTKEFEKILYGSKEIRCVFKDGKKLWCDGYPPIFNEFPPIPKRINGNGHHNREIDMSLKDYFINQQPDEIKYDIVDKNGKIADIPGITIHPGTSIIAFAPIDGNKPMVSEEFSIMATNEVGSTIMPRTFTYATYVEASTIQFSISEQNGGSMSQDYANLRLIEFLDPSGRTIAPNALRPGGLTASSIFADDAAQYGPYNAIFDDDKYLMSKFGDNPYRMTFRFNYKEYPQKLRLAVRRGFGVRGPSKFKVEYIDDSVSPAVWRVMKEFNITDKWTDDTREFDLQI